MACAAGDYTPVQGRGYGVGGIGGAQKRRRSHSVIMNFTLLFFHYNCLRSLTGYLPSHPSNRYRCWLLTIRCSGNEPALLPLKIRLAPMSSMSAQIEQAALIMLFKGGLRYPRDKIPTLPNLQGNCSP